MVLPFLFSMPHETDQVLDSSQLAKYSPFFARTISEQDKKWQGNHKRGTDDSAAMCDDGA